MAGFVAAYAAAQSPLLAPTIMDCFTPDRVPVISTLAQEFTVIDTYHASVPACTFPNRLFALSGTSGGYADNDSVMVSASGAEEVGGGRRGRRRGTLQRILQRFCECRCSRRWGHQ